MIRLYSGGGAQDIELTGEATPSASWTRLRGLAVKLLRGRGDARAADLLERYPFELQEATNGFGDEFSVLHWSAPLDQYLELGKSEHRVQSDVYADAAKAVSEVASTYVRFVVVELDTTDPGAANVAAPANLTITSDVVERALKDAEQLIASSGATSGLDRVHTALHGYLKAACDASVIAYTADPSITELFKVLTQQHPAFAAARAGSDHVERMARALATVVDASQPLRNRGSMAHPNASLLAEPEAMLVINAVHSLLHYLDARLK